MSNLMKKTKAELVKMIEDLKNSKSNLDIDVLKANLEESESKLKCANASIEDLINKNRNLTTNYDVLNQSYTKLTEEHELVLKDVDTYKIKIVKLESSQASSEGIINTYKEENSTLHAKINELTEEIDNMTSNNCSNQFNMKVMRIAIIILSVTTIIASLI